MGDQLQFIQLEVMVVALGLLVLLADLFLSESARRSLGWVAAGALGLVFLLSFRESFVGLADGKAFGGIYRLDGLALFFKRFFLVTAIFVLIFAMDFASRLKGGMSEYLAFILFALSGMMFASSANDFSLLFVAIELITVTFYILVSFQRHRMHSLEAGVKYLILGAVSSAFLVYGIALVFGEAGSLKFDVIRAAHDGLLGSNVFLFGMLFVFAGLAFKISAFPFQVWAPDVYQGAPTPTTTFLAVGSKAAGFVLLIRLFGSVVPELTAQWTGMLMVVAALTILYGNLCALPQRNLKRLLAYSGIANAGYLLMGIVAQSESGDGTAAILYYLAGYLFTLVAAFMIINLLARDGEGEDISCLAGLGKRSPFLALTLTLAVVSLAGIPPLAGFFGKFLLVKSVTAKAFGDAGYFALLAVAVFGVVVSIYYYFRIIRTIYWSKDTPDNSPVAIAWPTRMVLGLCVAAILYLGLLPDKPINWANAAAKIETVAK
ncbi:MAG: NADH-quinone oxidoreductase subunit N [Verrucomicrobia bacterium]|nr:NADH-quinone oxidoreductase subunit N [Verrucomicrobiota bacterium]MBT3841888.1 NADH-quinone oxidoreductase subunit N [Verrucomicrobiota bacterium]MBT5619624.1 NADH-quinone oxidoreductase subunit N [Verrucomicrobiota bacterium]MBT6102691.1 NADH-quinone oxidoreductase subunit N [Verrucomicrobiota bacterium]MBT6789585.1 NADH-quinone oxidoreductase subunit N [Verrucomicrobiota bacterium]